MSTASGTAALILFITCRSTSYTSLPPRKPPYTRAMLGRVGSTPTGIWLGDVVGVFMRSP
jgi:hypothetical protein